MPGRWPVAAVICRQAANSINLHPWQLSQLVFAGKISCSQHQFSPMTAFTTGIYRLDNHQFSPMTSINFQLWQLSQLVFTGKTSCSKHQFSPMTAFTAGNALIARVFAICFLFALLRLSHGKMSFIYSFFLS